MAYKKIDLPYDFNALEPYMDEETVKVHYLGHHSSYEDKLEQALSKTDIGERFDNLIDLMVNYQTIEDYELKAKIRQYGGGVINHNFFWTSLKKDTELRDSNLIKAIEESWGSVDEFRKALKAETLNLFGSGWVWLVKRKDGGLKIVRTFNQDTPWFIGMKPLLAIDVWEHAYYLKHRGDRVTWFEDMWNLFNWDFVADQFNK